MSYYSDATLSDNPQAYYRLDESSGIVATDASTHGNNGVYAGSITFGQSGALLDDSDTAALFGISDTVSVPFTRVQPLTWSAMTLIFWIKLSGGFHMVAVAVDATSTICYLDGSVTTPGTGSGDKIVISQNMTYAGSGASGTLDEIALFQYKMGATEIAHLYSVGTTNRSGIAKLPATSRRAGLTLATARRTGLVAATRRKGLVSNATRRAGVTPTTKRRGS